ncbi:hypothetical protein [Neisseria leonii]|uniref:hypothetical protein n=1 Tax=Neisseria leonii TaxID=2995413 RepID=UPI00237B9322|nr:hypothetical protein [Neisseria sp. 3986]MDD9325612.1 hypothetical protein [Neisseria sp. 3986]
MKHQFDLAWGVPYNGSTFRTAVLRPLTIGGELAAMTELDELPPLPDDAAPAARTARSVYETLIYWAQQLNIDGVPPDALTADYLMANLTGEDYRQILNEMDVLAGKSAAATGSPAPAAAAKLPEAGASVIKTTDKP